MVAAILFGIIYRRYAIAAVQPALYIKVIILLTPKYTCKRFALNIFSVLSNISRYDGIIKIVCLLLANYKNIFKAVGKWVVILLIGKTTIDGFSFACLYCFLLRSLLRLLPVTIASLMASLVNIDLFTEPFTLLKLVSFSVNKASAAASK